MENRINNKNITLEIRHPSFIGLHFGRSAIALAIAVY